MTVLTAQDLAIVRDRVARARLACHGGDPAPANRREWRTPSRDLLRQPSLTIREREVIELVAEGLSNKEISATLGTSVETVANQVKSVLRKLEARNRTQAAAIFTRSVQRERTIQLTHP